MAQRQQGVVTKIYELKIVGYDTMHQQFTNLTNDLARIKKLILELQGQKISLGPGRELDQVNQQIVEASQLQGVLEKKMAAVTEQSKTSAGAFARLSVAYQAAKKNAEDLAAEYGVESAAAKEAAATAEQYKQKLIEINNLVKSGGKTVPLNAPVPLQPDATIQPTTPQPVPFTHNLDELAAEQAAIQKTGEAVSELDKQQAAAAISAEQYGQANKTVATEVTESAATISGVTTKYEQYTGSLRDNIRVQLENNSTLAANRAQQKEIEAAISETGRASDAQLTKLAALKEEEQLLIETNKQLSVTIRNQAKEFIASAGSLDEQQAQLNQLQQAYEQLSETEKASPFGQEMKKEIDILEPKVKSLEAELGKFSRNVGNYPTVFGGAFKVLNSELDNVQGKLVKGNFGSKELADLTAKEQVLTNATKVLGQTFATTAQQQAAFKEQGRQLAITFGTESEVFKNFSKQVALGNATLKQTDQELTKSTASGNKFTGALSSMYGGIRKLANIIPGLGISGVILLLLSPLSALATSLFNVGKASKSAGNDIKDLQHKYEEANKAVHESQQEFVDAATNVESLRINVNLAKEGLLDKKKVVEQYNESMGRVTGQVKELDEVELQLVKNGPAYINMMLYKAAANIALEKAAMKAFEVEELRRKKESEFSNVIADTRISTGGSGGLGTGQFNAREYDAETARIEAAQKKRKEKEIKIAEDAEKEQLSIAEKFRKDAANTAIERGFNFFPEEKTKKEKKSDPLQDELLRIETLRLTQVSIENKRVNEIEKIHELSFDEEIFHLKAIETINVNALDQKIAIYTKEKKLTIEQNKSLAELEEQKSTMQLQTSQKINDVEKKRFNDNVKDLKNQLDQQLEVIKDNNQKIQEDVNASNFEKAAAQVTADDAEIAARQEFFDKLSGLNADYNKQALIDAQKAIDDKRQVREKDLKTVSLSSLKEVQDQGERDVRQIQTDYNIKTTAVLNNEKLMSDKKKKFIETLNKAEKITILSSELHTLTHEVAQIQILVSQGLKSYDDYLKAVEKQTQKAEELGQAMQDALVPDEEKLKRKFASFKSLLQSSLRDVFNITEGSIKDEKLGEVISGAFSLAQDAMNAYFDAEEARIQHNLEVQQERIDMDYKQASARAQSVAEQESLDKQYATRKKEADKQAFEQTKALKKKEALISLASELANIWATVWSVGPIAGAVLGAALSLLAFGRYSLRVSQINSQTYAEGGMPGEKAKPTFKQRAIGVARKAIGFGGQRNEVPVRGGEFKGKPHSKGGTDFYFKGQRHNAEVKELAVIRTRNAPANERFKIEGNQMQIASAANVIGGGKDFRPGAKIKKFALGGSIGASLQPPVYTPSTNSTSVINNVAMANEKFDELIDVMNRNTEEVQKQINRIEVHQVTQSVTDAQNKRVKQTNIGTLGT